MALIDNRDGTLIDPATSFQWQKEDDGVERTYEEAIEYCASLRLAGHSDWELPGLAEFDALARAGGPTRSPNSGLEYWTRDEFYSPGMPKEIVGKVALTSEGLSFYKYNRYCVIAMRRATP